MNCPNCRAYNPGNARYCGRCGTTLETPSKKPRNGDHRPLFGDGRTQQPHSQPSEPRPADGLKPRKLGELVRETLAVYAGNLRVMWSISLVANVPLFVAVFPSNPAAISSITLAGFFTGLLGYAAATYAVSRWYIGRKTNAATCFVAALNSSVSLLLAGLVFFFAVLAGLILSLLLIGIPALVFVVVVWVFYVQAIVIEGKGPAESLRRSYNLVRGSWWRVFGIGVAFVALLLAVTSIAALPGILLGLKHQLLGDLLVTLGSVFVTPISYIAAPLVYFDLRVRKEGYTLETLALELGFSQETPPQGPASPPS